MPAARCPVTCAIEIMAFEALATPEI